MKILIVNDDGISAEGIHRLAKWATRLGEVTVCAPKAEQSGKSHAINFIDPMKIKRVDFPCSVEAYSVDSTPADCVRFGIVGLGRKYDLVLSGINNGVNMSGDIVYSGTVGAIFEAAHQGHRALALSIAKEAPQPSDGTLDMISQYIGKNRLFDKCGLYNINIPKDPIAPRITKQGSAYFSDEFFHQGNGIYIQRGHAVPETNPEDKSIDTVAFAEGYISITPMTLSRTDMGAFEILV